MKKVILLDTNDNRSKSRLKKHIGKTFTVARETEDFYYIEELGNIQIDGWYKERFRLTKESMTLDDILGL